MGNTSGSATITAKGSQTSQIRSASQNPPITNNTPVAARIQPTALRGTRAISSPAIDR